MRRRSEYEEDERLRRIEEWLWRIAFVCFLITVFAQLAKSLIEIFAIAG